MKLITKAIEKNLPKLYSTDGMKGKQKVIVKFFTPDSSFTWFILEGEKNENDDMTFFGLVTGGCADELGYVTLSELHSAKGPLGLPIERDKWWDDKQTLEQAAPKFCENLWG